MKKHPSGKETGVSTVAPHHRFVSAGGRSSGRREEQQGSGLTVWFTGLSGSGKTTICRSVFDELAKRSVKVELLDSEVLRTHFNADLSFSKRDRTENVRRLAFAAHILTRNGIIVLVAAISPYRETREEVRNLIGDFLEVHVNAPLEVCKQWDPKGIYRKADMGAVHNLTGIDDPYESPLSPEVRCDTDRETIRESTIKVLAAIDGFLASRLERTSAEHAAL